MKHFKKLMCAAVSAVMLIVLMCGCGNQSDTEEDNSQYDYLKDEIVGIWMQEGGTVLTEDPIFGYSYPFFEFTSNNEVYNHYVILDENKDFADAASKSGTYRIDGNLLVYIEDNVGAYIDIKDGVMTMTTDSGESKYERLSVAQALEGSLYYKDEELLKQENELQAELDKEAYESASQAAETEESAAETETDASETEVSESETSETEAADTETSEVTESETEASSAE